MLVILKENVQNLGLVGDLVRVSAGYARNFLIPKKLVVAANERNVAAIDHQKKMLEKKRLAQRSAAEELAKKLNEFSCTLTRKTGDGDKLFGSVTVSDIIEELSKAGFVVEKHAVQMESQIKTLGVHTVAVRLQPEVIASLKVWVVKEGGDTAEGAKDGDKRSKAPKGKGKKEPRAAKE